MSTRQSQIFRTNRTGIQRFSNIPDYDKSSWHFPGFLFFRVRGRKGKEQEEDRPEFTEWTKLHSSHGNSEKYIHILRILSTKTKLLPSDLNSRCALAPKKEILRDRYKQDWIFKKFWGGKTLVHYPSNAHRPQGQ